MLRKFHRGSTFNPVAILNTKSLSYVDKGVLLACFYHSERSNPTAESLTKISTGGVTIVRNSLARLESQKLLWRGKSPNPITKRVEWTFAVFENSDFYDAFVALYGEPQKNQFDAQ